MSIRQAVTFDLDDVDAQVAFARRKQLLEYQWHRPAAVRGA